jgi:hypothetical protein
MTKLSNRPLANFVVKLALRIAAGDADSHSFGKLVQLLAILGEGWTVTLRSPEGCKYRYSYDIPIRNVVRLPADVARRDRFFGEVFPS